MGTPLDAVDTSRPVEIADGVYWVGVADHPLGLQCNPYLLVDGDEGLISDPGSILDFEYVLDQVERIMPVSQLSWITLSHQDPDLCSAVPLFERAGFRGRIATHWRASVLQRYYGFTSSFYLVNEHDWRLEFESGRPILFIPTPYLHFPGAVATYDPRTKVLFPGDLFGAFSVNWNFNADKATYMEGMKAFHEHYMPSNDNLRPVMEVLLGMDIEVIAPQHGSVIREDVRDYIIALRELECGTMLRPIRRELGEQGGYKSVVEQVIRRLCSIFPPDEVLSAFEETDLRIDPGTLEITDFETTGPGLWDGFFETIAAVRGKGWLTVVQPLVEKLSAEFDISLPAIYRSAQAAAELRLTKLSSENAALRLVNERLDATLRDTEDRLTRCPVTGLRNEFFYSTYLEATLGRGTAELGEVFLLLIGIDGYGEISFSMGRDAADETLRAVTYVLESCTTDRDLIFRMEGPVFAVVVAGGRTRDEAGTFAERLRMAVGDSEVFLARVTVSVGLAALVETDSGLSPQEAARALTNLAVLRRHIARNRGGNTVCAASDPRSRSTAAGTVLIADPDPVSIDVLRTALEALRFRVLACTDGIEALRTLERESVDVVVSESVLPKMDGFALREQMLASSDRQDIPFILMTFDKDAESVARAQGLGVDHIFQKPFLLSELVGTVRLHIKPQTGS